MNNSQTTLQAVVRDKAGAPGGVRAEDKDGDLEKVGEEVWEKVRAAAAEEAREGPGEATGNTALPISIKLHQKHGFRIVGTREKIGKPDQQWRDIILMERRSKKTGIG